MAVYIDLIPIKKSCLQLKQLMSVHYSKPKGFVGRQLIYKVEVAGVAYGAIAAGSSTLYLPGRDAFFAQTPLNNIVNNTFFHLQGPYPFRNFTTTVVRNWRDIVSADWCLKYGDRVLGWETLVELPRTGELYLRDGWLEVGITKGYTCKRIAGKGTDSWSGARSWDVENLRPKRVLVRAV